jgi:hypothetical protein
MDALQLRYPKCAFRPKTQVFHLFTCRRLAKCFETLPNIILGPMESNGCFATSVPWNSAFRPETQVLHLLRAEAQRNALKHSQTPFWVQWSGMDALQLRYPEIVHSGPKRKFCIFYVLKVSQMLWNTPKHHFGSNGVEWMLNNFGTPK